MGVVGLRRELECQEPAHQINAFWFNPAREYPRGFVGHC